MTATDVLTRIREAGGEVVLVDGTPRLRAAAPLPEDVVTLAREHRAELLQVLLDGRQVPCAGCTQHGNPPRPVRPDPTRPEWRGTLSTWCDTYRETWRDLASAYAKQGHPKAAAEHLAFEELQVDACGKPGDA
jgi:hypothetical protein